MGMATTSPRARPRPLGLDPGQAPARSRRVGPAQDQGAGGQTGGTDGRTDLRCRSKLRDFFFQWLKVEQIPDLAKDPAAVRRLRRGDGFDLRTSLDLLVEDLVWSEASDFRQLLLTDELFLNGRLAQF